MYQPQLTASYDPSHLLDGLLRRLNLEGDAALATALNIGPGFLHQLRMGDVLPGAALLMRMHEKTGISIRELRQMLGDRRSQCRVDDSRFVTPGRARGTPPTASPVPDDAGLPNMVQWT